MKFLRPLVFDQISGILCAAFTGFSAPYTSPVLCRPLESEMWVSGKKCAFAINSLVRKILNYSVLQALQRTLQISLILLKDYVVAFSNPQPQLNI